MTDLVLGPLLRHVDETSATIWVETRTPARVTVTGSGRDDTRPKPRRSRCTAITTRSSRSTGSAPGEKYPYTVAIDGRQVWPEADSAYPPSLIPTLDDRKPLRLAFGSCRTSVPHDEAGNRKHGVDALRAYALRMAGITDGSHPDDPDPGREVRWPDLVLFLGDQVYADETSEEIQAFIESRRDIEEPPGEELKDYQEYAELYRLAWTDPANRWLLSTVPSAMIFDDHDIRDDWNTSLSWKREMEATEWWHERIVSGLASYWVYQHLGNLTPDERAADEVWQKIAAHEGTEEYDATELLARRWPSGPTRSRRRTDGATAATSATRPGCWSSTRGRPGCSIPSAGRCSTTTSCTWLDERMRGGFEHVLVGTSLPFLLAPGLHYVEAFSEALASGGWGKAARREGRRADAPARRPRALGGVPEGLPAGLRARARGAARRARDASPARSRSCPATCTTATSRRHARRSGDPIRGRFIQAVCSPIRNPLPRAIRFATAGLSYGVAGPVGHVVAASAKVPQAPVDWRLLKGPWFDNNIATLEIRPGEGLRMWWATGEVENGHHDRPRFAQVAEVVVS